MRLKSTFERVDTVSCPDGLRDGVPDDWSGDRKRSVTELSSRSWNNVVAAVRGA